MKLINHFTWFMTETVNLNASRISDLDSRFETMRKYLVDDTETGSAFIAQGSYAHRTIIKPQEGEEFDVDGLILMEYRENWMPSDYLKALDDAFDDHHWYKTVAEPKSRCVRIDYKDEFHIDVVPYVIKDDKHYIVHAEGVIDEFENTNPEGLSAWMDERDRITGGRFVEVVRLIKYLRDFKGKLPAKSVLINTLLGEAVDPAKEASYADLPTTLRLIVSDLDAYLQDNEEMPTISDPSCPEQDFNHRWDDNEYARFRDDLHRYAGWIEDAYNAPDEASSLQAWQKLFGDAFSTPPADKVVAFENARADAPLEEHIHDKYPYAPTVARLDVVGTTVKKPGFPSRPLSRNGNKVSRDTWINFDVRNRPAAGKLYWKVRNHGADAIAKEELRGQLMEDAGRNQLREHTAFRGRHYVEAYVVHQGRCIAKGRQDVIVPNW